MWLFALMLLVGAETAAAATEVRRYRAWDSKGDPRVARFTERRGDCYTSSFQSARGDAWRCIAGNRLMDPCFENPMFDNEVLCVAAPWSREGVLVRSRLDPDDRFATTHPRPWALELRAHRCVFLSGGTLVLMGHRLNYACGRNGPGLYGVPIRKRPTWRIRSARTPDADRFPLVPIRVAWR